MKDEAGGSTGVETGLHASKPAWTRVLSVGWRRLALGPAPAGVVRSALLTALAAGLVLAGLPPAAGQESRTQSWTEVKCERYARAWTELLARRGRAGLGPDFVDRHDAFIASGCTARPDVCPRSPEELDVANALVILAMNAGTASTFLPFACRR